MPSAAAAAARLPPSMALGRRGWGAGELSTPLTRHCLPPSFPRCRCSELLKPDNFEAATTEIFGPFQVSQRHLSASWLSRQPHVCQCQLKQRRAVRL